MQLFCFSSLKAPSLRSRRCVNKSFRALLFIFPLSNTSVAGAFIFQGDEKETLNILRRIYKINNPNNAIADYNVTKVVEDLEFIDNDTKEITNVSENPFVMFWKQTCLLFSKNNLKKTVLICLLQVSRAI